MLAVRLSSYVKYSPVEGPVQSWNLPQLTEELQKQVVGQQDVIMKITGEISETFSRPDDTKWLKIIFLIGGPSVGKGLVIDIIHNHLLNNNLSSTTGDISNITSTSQNFCSQILKNSSIDIDFMFLKNYKISELLLNSEDTKNRDEFSVMIKNLEDCIILKNKKAILFVSSEVVTENEAIEFNDREQYDVVLDSIKQSLLNYTRKRSLEYKMSTIIFHPLAASEVMICLQMQGLDEKHLRASELAVSTWRNYRAGFVPQGCRPLNLDLTQSQDILKSPETPEPLDEFQVPGPLNESNEPRNPDLLDEFQAPGPLNELNEQ